MKKNEILSCAAKCMGLEPVVLGETGQTQQSKCHLFPLTHRIQKVMRRERETVTRQEEEMQGKGMGGLGWVRAEGYVTMGAPGGVKLEEGVEG